jgi:hypothetical protein
VQDSALLVRGSDGMIYATPRADPTFSGQPSSPPSVDPVPQQSTTTITTTSVVVFTSCPPGVSCPALSSTTQGGVISPGQQSTTAIVPPATTLNGPITGTPPSTSGVSLTDGGVRPVPTTTRGLGNTTPAPPSGSSTPGGNNVDAQFTFTNVKPYTEYVVQVVTVCPSNPATCTVVTETSTVTGLRTQLSCSPGICTGAMIRTDVDAAFAAATCVERI